MLPIRVVDNNMLVWPSMATPKLAHLELRIMDVLWKLGTSSVREIQEAFPAKDRPAYTTVQTTVYRLETKKVVRLVKRVGKANIYEPIVSQAEAQGRFIDDLLAMFGGRMRLLVAHLIESGKFTEKDVTEAEEVLRNLKKAARRKEKSK
jgi:BlaI family penicillinase repressor